MKVPMDRYRILGVNMGSDNQFILNQLERRIGKCEYQGFSNETLAKRAEILQECSGILLDGEKRKEYEKEYILQTSSPQNLNEPETTISKGQEIAALLLLLEAGAYEECIGIAENLYREQRMSMSYFSSEYKEINRIIDYATLGLAKELKYKRHFETAAEVLERRINSQSVGMGEKDRILQMNIELSELLPFRVLDTLSRDNDERAHLKGIHLLKRLVEDRGGLEAISSKYMESNEFYEFFKQIRSYLSAQEQISMYEEWGLDGSNAAIFLNCIALTAQGFAQRKPHRIDEALRKMEQMQAGELKPMVANMHLLLGNVETATQVFEKYADKELKEWAHQRTQDPLGSLCEWCREWLKRDVVKGYRDIDVDIDLESYFSDKDVVQYIEDRDMNKNTHKLDKQQQKHWDRQIRKQNTSDDSTNTTRTSRSHSNWENQVQWNNSIYKFLKENVLVIAIIAASTCSLLIFRSLDSQQNTIKATKSNDTGLKEQTAEKPVLSTTDELGGTLNEWLLIKSKSLQTNEIPDTATQVATPRLLEQLRQEMKENKRRGLTQTINVEVKRIDLKEETPRTARINAELVYKDSTRNKNGEILKETSLHTFQRRYNFVWNGQKWIIDRL